jgi:hypothetical protein
MSAVPHTSEIRWAATTGPGSATPEQFDDWLAERDRAVAENAWEQGLLAERAAHVVSNMYGMTVHPEPNPYREREAQTAAPRVEKPQHRPVGEYLPVGQLDGDCACGRGPYPCPDTPAEER